MKRFGWVVAASVAGLWALVTATAAPPKPVYVKKGTRAETVIASLKEAGLPTLQGKWYVIGPFDSDGNEFDTPYPPEKEIDLKKTYAGKGGETVAWKEFADFGIVSGNNLKRYKN